MMDPSLRPAPEFAGSALTLDPSMGPLLQREAQAYRDADPTTLEQLGAAYSRVTSLAPLLSPDRPTFERDPNFDPAPLLRPDEIVRHGAVFSAARSQEELEWLRQERARLDRLDQVLAGGPLHPFVAGMIASVFDPINLLPVGPLGVFARGAGLGSRLVQGAALGVAGNLAVEPFLREADPFRDLNDTLGDVLVGGIFGAGLGGLTHLPNLRRGGDLTPEALAARAEHSAAIDRVEAERLGLPPERMAEARAGLTGAVQELNAARAAALDGSGTAGAAITAQVKAMDDALRGVSLELAGPKWLQTVGRVMGSNMVTALPGYTLLTSRLSSSRQIISQIAETGLDTRATARDLTAEDFRRAYPEAVRKGWVGSQEDFIAAATERARTGLTQAAEAPLFSRIALWQGRMKGFMDEWSAATAEAKNLGFTGSRDDFDTQLVQYARYLEEPDRFTSNPFEALPWRPAMDRAIKAWQEKIAQPALGDINRVGIWQDTVGGAAPRPNYFPKAMDREAIISNMGAFQNAWVQQLTEAVNAAAAKVKAFDDVMLAYKNRQADAEALIKAVRASPTLRNDRGAQNLIRLLNEEKRASKAVDDLEREVRAEMGSTAFEFMSKMREQGGPPRAVQGEPKTVEEQLFDGLEAAYAKRDAAGQLYESVRKREAERLQAATGLPVPPSRGPLPEKPPGYEEAKVLVSDPEKGLTSPQAIAAEAAKIAEDIAFGADPNRFMEIGLRASLKGRGLDMDPQRFREFFQSSFLKTVENYNSMVARDVETFRAFGRVDGSGIARPIMEEALEAQKAALDRGDTKGAERIMAEAQRDVELVQNLIAKARGTFDQAQSQQQQTVQSAVRAGMALSFMARMGSGLLAQIGDLTTSISRYGATRVFGAALQRMGMAFTAEGAALSKRAREQFGTALDWSMNDQQRALFDVAPAAAPLGPIGRGIDRMTPTFSKLTLMPWWNDQMRMIGVILTENLMIEGALAAKAGKPIPREAADLFSRAGFNSDRVAALAEQFEKTGTMRGNLYDSNLEAWMTGNPELADAYRAAVHVGAQRMLITPTAADRPFWTQRTIGQAVMQFKGFIMASLPQLLVPFIQSPAGRKIEVLIAALAVGALSTTLRDLNTRGEVKDRNTAGWVIDSLDMSGLVSFLTEADATLGRINPHLSAKRLLTGEELSRFQNRTDLGAFLGPLAGMAGSAAEAAKGFSDAALFSDKEIEARHARALRTILPYQNYILLRHGLDVMEAATFEDAKARGLVAPYLYPERPRPAAP